jgi:hypothetical protein
MSGCRLLARIFNNHNQGGETMFSKHSVPMFITFCMLCVLGETSARAADLALVAKPHRHASVPPKAASAKRLEKPHHRGITTYRLYDDPAFKLRGALAERRQFPLSDRFIGPTNLGAVSASVTPAGSAYPGSMLDASQTNDDATALNCWTQAPASIPRVRGLTACYRQPVDKGWSTQTYVSRVSTGGRPDWGGGVALSFAD